MIIIQIITHIYVSGTLCLCVDYLHRALNKTACPHSPPLYIQNTCYMTVEKYADHHQTSLIDLKLEKDIFFGVLMPLYNF